MTIRPPWISLSVPHCNRCSQFMDALRPDEVTPNLKSMLNELWFEHQDRTDDVRCWNAWASIFEPTEVVDLEKMEAESNAAAEQAEREQYEKLKSKFG